MTARAVSLRSSPSSTHHLSWLSPPHSLSPMAVTIFHSAPLGVPLLRSPPTGVVTLLTHSPSGRLPSLPLLSRSSPSSTDSSTLRPFGSPPSPAEGPDLQPPCPSSPALSPWLADPWLPTPLPPPLKPPPLGSQSGSGRGQKRCSIATNQSVAPPL